MLDDQYRYPLLRRDAGNQLRHIVNQSRRKPRRRLVEHQEPWLRYQRSGEGRHPLFATTERSGILPQTGLQ